MKQLQFTKMHGLGNDFILIDNRGNIPIKFETLAQKLCERRFGIGADQLLLLEDSAAADYRMRIFNPDGSEVEMCGNGVRCTARFIRDKRIAVKEQLLIETKAGVVKTRWEKDQVEVDMGEPVLEAENIPVKLEGRVISVPLALNGIRFEITCVSMGNPHCLILVDDLAGFAVAEYGPKIEHHPLFPKRTNVEFVKVINQQQIEVRVWERGAGETLACGSGACASVVATVLNQLTQRRVRVRLPGGELGIFWSPEDNRVYMQGPSEYVFEGSIDIAVE
jgi:diaminopimelate epimerase